MAYSATQVARWILSAATRQGLSITHIQLQKILYYCQGMHVGITGKPMFNEDLCAWEHGPVVPDIYREYKPCGRDSISVEPTPIPDDVEGLINKVVADKGRVYVWDLCSQTHCEPPYQETPRDEVISLEKLDSFFGSQFWGGDEEDLYSPSFETEEEAVAHLADSLSEDELDAIASIW